MPAPDRSPLELFLSSPRPPDSKPDELVQRTVEMATWCEEAGFKGILVPSDNRAADPWLVTQRVLQRTSHLCPLVVVQPLYMHPFSLAKMVSALVHMYGRRLYLSMAAGGFNTDLLCLDDHTSPHDRYQRLGEYAGIVSRLLGNDGPVTFEGRFYSIVGLELDGPPPAQLLPKLLIAGSSEAGLAAAEAVGAVPVQFPRPSWASDHAETPERDFAIRVGIITRERASDAWQVAFDHFPPDRRGEFKRKLTTRLSGSFGHQELFELGQALDVEHLPYWMHPFQTARAHCPYLVGDHRTVASELARSIERGARTFIVDTLKSHEDLDHVEVVFGRAWARAHTPLILAKPATGTDRKLDGGRGSRAPAR